jgi:hypothetical protein
MFSFIIASALFSCKPSLSEKEIQQYRQEGDEIVKIAGGKLSSTLITKIEEGGISEAVRFCNHSALPITSEISAQQGAEIKRTSLKIRNPENRPSEEEVLVLNHFEDMLNKGEAIEPLVSLDKEGRPHYYAPIRVQKKCLMCHGEMNKELSVTVDSIIKSSYPKDLATGYREGDLRGMWSVAFDPVNH